MLTAYIQGYSDRMVDQQILAVQSGYWSAYYTNSKHPKAMSSIAEKIVRNHEQSMSKAINKPKADVDVEAFLAQEALFQAKLSESRKVGESIG